MNIIVAFDKNMLIGNNDSLPWYLPEDLKRFKKMTTGNTIIMGRKTYESIGKALPDRENIVLTRDKKFRPYDATVINSIEELFKLKLSGDLYVIGGAQVYKQLYDFTQTIHLTLIDNEYEGNAYLPFTLDDIKRDFNLVYKEEKDGFMYLGYNRTLRGS